MHTFASKSSCFVANLSYIYRPSHVFFLRYSFNFLCGWGGVDSEWGGVSKTNRPAFVSNDFGEIVFSERPVLLQWLHRVGCLIAGDQVDQSTEDMRSYAGRNTMACSERNVSPET